jgi:hypothetical protein
MKKLLIVALLGLTAACVPVAPVAVSDLSNMPAEQALLAGIRLYEDAQYVPAERELRRALDLKLHADKDIANANKYLAFIYCTSERVRECESAFRAARAAQPDFALSKSEAGHPVWGPVYKQVMGQR